MFLYLALQFCHHVLVDNGHVHERIWYGTLIHDEVEKIDSKLFHRSVAPAVMTFTSGAFGAHSNDIPRNSLALANP